MLRLRMQPLRFWAIDLEGSERMIVNDLGLIHNFSLCKLNNLKIFSLNFNLKVKNIY